MTAFPGPSSIAGANGPSSPNDPIQALLRLAGEATPYPPTSRYHTIALGAHTMSDGRVVPFMRRRIVPSPVEIATLRAHRVAEGERPDTIAAGHLGDPTQWWRLCDANGAMDTAELTARPGRMIRIGLPKGVPGGG